MKQFAIMKHSVGWLFFWACLMIGSVVMFIVHMRRSIEFTGWVSVILNGVLEEQAVKSSVGEMMKELWYTDYNIGVTPDESITTLLIKVGFKQDTDAIVLTDTLRKVLVDDAHLVSEDDIVSLSLIGPSIGDYMKKSAVSALIIGLILMAVYMMISFSGIRRVIPPFTLAMVAIVTMLFDVSIPAGAYGILMRLNSTIQIDTVFIIAILTTMWYSINDTIIVFDRIRENSTNDQAWLRKNTILMWKLIDVSLWQTLRRSIGTSFSTLLVVIAMYVFGSGVIQTFSFVVWFGIIAGTFSSMFVASPLVYILMWSYRKEQNKL